MAQQEPTLNGTSPAHRAGPQLSELALELGGLAQLAIAAGAADGCLIAVHSPLGVASVWAAVSGVVQLPSNAPVLDMALRWSNRCGGRPVVVHRLSPSESAILRSLQIDIALSATLTVVCETQGHQRLAVAMVSAGGGAAAKATAELAARCTSILLRDLRHAGQVSFWRAQAAMLRDTLQTVRTQTAKAARERNRDLASNRRLAANAARGSLGAVASNLSRLGPFEGWFLATREADGFQIRAVHGLPRSALPASDASMEEVARRRVIVGRRWGATATLPPWERRLHDRGYRAYLSVPLEAGTLVLLSRAALTVQTRAQVAAAIKGITPQLRVLRLSRELAHQRALVRSLVSGLFKTAEAERASLRRDLHDDWAQLLAAAKIALDGRTEDARHFFRELEVELRKRLDALRPPSARRGGLEAAITAEAQRLRTAGIEVTLDVSGIRRLPAAAREALRRVLGEGVSNVIRHAKAGHVAIELQCRAGVASLAIADDGRGSRNGAAAMGTGLRGLIERVAVLGGTCNLDSRPDGARLCATIPVADL